MNAKEFLNKIGVESETIESLFAEETPEGFELEAASKSYLESIKTVQSENPEMVSKLKAEAKGEILSKTEHNIKKFFGLVAEETEWKKLDELLPVIQEKLSNTANEGAEELQNKLLEANRKIKTFEGETIPAIQAEANKKIKDFRVKTEVLKSMAGVETVVNTEIIYPAIQEHLENHFSFEVDENNELTVKTVAGTKPTSADGTKLIGLNDIVKEHITALGVLKQSNGSETTEPTKRAATPTPEPQGTPKYNIPHLAKAQQNLQTLKETIPSRK